MGHRTVCIDVPEIFLQLVLQQAPAQKELPLAILDEDKPNGRLLSVNKAARTHGITTGMRYGAALALCPTLLGVVHDEQRLSTLTHALHATLMRFSPRVEVQQAGVFFVDATGMNTLFPEAHAYADAIAQAIQAQGLFAGVVVGFSRFHTWIAAKMLRGQGVVVFDDAAQEQQHVQRASLTRLGLSPASLSTLTKLGVRTVADFIALPTTGLKRRFAPDVVELFLLARGDVTSTIHATAPRTPLVLQADFDVPKDNCTDILSCMKPLLLSLISQLSKSGKYTTELTFILRTYRTKNHLEHTLRPAAPTNDADSLLKLCALRLQSLTLHAGIDRVVVRVQGEDHDAAQLTMHQHKPKRDPQAALRAAAALRALLGDDSVVVAELTNEHLPHKRFTWRTPDVLPPARPTKTNRLAWVRRVYQNPHPLPFRPTREPDGWLLRGVEHGPVVRTHGPYIISGGWLSRDIERAFYFAEMSDGAVLWIFYDQEQRRWFMQGELA